jgi:hypothetical protein
MAGDAVTWHAIRISQTKHATSAEFSDAQYEWAVCDRRHPVSLVEVLPCQDEDEAREVARRMNGGASGER